MSAISQIQLEEGRRARWLVDGGGLLGGQQGEEDGGGWRRKGSSPPGASADSLLVEGDP